MKRSHPPLLSLSWSLLTIACHSGSDAGGGPVGLETASSSPTSTGTDPPTTSLPTTSAPSSTSTVVPTDTTGSTSEGATGGSTTTANEPGTSSSGTTEPAPSASCGDAILDPGEECDLGATENDDQGACNVECKLAKCGDHLIWTGKESCDNGSENNDSVYGGCTTQCKYGPRCGDGKLQGPEECDLGPVNGTGEFLPNSVPCANTCRFAAKMVFLSSVAYTGGEIEGSKKAHEWSKSNPGDKGNAGLSGVDKVQEQAWIQWNEKKQWTAYTSYGCDLPYRIYCFEQ